MRMTAPGISNATMMPEPGSGDAPQKEEAKALQPKLEGRRNDLAGEAPGIVPDALRSPGHKLDAPARAFFEPRFSADFSSVRLHCDALAARSASAIGAKAYTVGTDIVFGAGWYQPESAAGQRLLAHELAHVVQQSGGAAGRVGAAAVGVQREVETLGGTWDTGNYAILKDGGKDIGVTMNRLLFIVTPISLPPSLRIA
jgi:hypothetical protein